MEIKKLVIDRAAEINDSVRRPAIKERMLITLFKKANITLSFTGKAT